MAFMVLASSGIFWPLRPAWAASTGPDASDLRVLVVPVEFPDRPHLRTVKEIEDLIFYRLRAYFSEVSYGRVNLGGVVLDWVKAPKRLSYYGGDDGGVDRSVPVLVRHACYLASGRPGVRLSDYDRVVIVHAGEGQETSRVGSDIWSACWTGLDIRVGEAQVSTAVVVSEYEGQGVDLLGPYAHEMLHALGLQDVGGGLGRWDVMGRGAYFGSPPGSSPAHPCAYDKVLLGWIPASRIVTVASDSEVQLAPFESMSKGALAVKILLRPGIYYLVEFRSYVGFNQTATSPALLTTLVKEGRGADDWEVSFLPLNEDSGSGDEGQVSLSLSLEGGYGPDLKFVDEENGVVIEGYRSFNATALKITFG